MEVTSNSFRFTSTAVAHRTARIPVSKWDEHKAEAIEIYLASNLAEVVREMKLRHGFYANERQYVYHFKKWGVKKHTVSRTEEAAAQSPLPQSSTQEQGALKRRRSTFSSRSGLSTRSTTEKPPTKKHEVSTVVLISDRDHDEFGPPPGGIVCDEVETGILASLSGGRPDPVAIATAQSRPDNTDLHMGSALLPSPHVSEQHPVDQEEVRPSRQAASSSPPTPKRPDSSHQQESGAPTSIYGEDGSLNEPRAEAEADEKGAGAEQHSDRRTIDRNQPVDNFSDQDMMDIGRAADCFAALQCHQEAFELYITMLKRRHSNPTKYDRPGFWYLVIRCANTASRPEHVEVMESILQVELHRSDNSPTHRFLLNMLLSFVCGGHPNVEVLHLFASEESVLASLSPSDRSLDLAVYLAILHLRTGSPRCTAPLSAPVQATSPDHWDAERIERYQDVMLQRTPGPFEALPSFGHMQNPCIRSCLLWCKNNLSDRAASSVSTDRTVIPSGDLISPAAATFIWLWARSNTDQFTDIPIWITNAQTTMGISSNELLMVICHMLYSLDGCWFALKADACFPSLRLLDQRAALLLEVADLQLGRMFLIYYAALTRHVVPSQGFQCVSHQTRQQILAYIEETLHVTFPNLGAASSNVCIPSLSLREGSQHLNGDELPAEPQGRKFSPTLASSLRSSDLSNFRETKLRAALRLKRQIGGSLSLRSSSEISTRREHSMSIAGLSDISTSLRSMSISGESGGQQRYSAPIPGSIRSLLAKSRGSATYQRGNLEVEQETSQEDN
ncbi:hypothetical protein OQA88_908 [Cercophora sp. LCS_1]